MCHNFFASSRLLSREKHCVWCVCIILSDSSEACRALRFILHNVIQRHNILIGATKRIWDCWAWVYDKRGRGGGERKNIIISYIYGSSRTSRKGLVYNIHTFWFCHGTFAIWHCIKRENISSCVCMWEIERYREEIAA